MHETGGDEDRIAKTWWDKLSVDPRRKEGMEDVQTSWSWDGKQKGSEYEEVKEKGVEKGEAVVEFREERRDEYWGEKGESEHRENSTERERASHCSTLQQ